MAAADPQSWLLSQPQLIIVLFAGAIWLANLLARARRRSAEADDAPGPGRAAPAVRPTAEDPGEDERTRRVRAEILRRIAERRAVAPPAQPARATIERWPAGRPEPAAEAAARTEHPPAPSQGARASPPAAPAWAAAAAPPAGAAFLEELRGRESARRAILVREILGPPVALR